MPTKQISNAGQAWAQGATWLIDLDNQMTQTVAHLLNATGQTLYEGDIVCIDVTGTQAIRGTGAATPTEKRLLGVVGGEIASNIAPAAGGGLNPFQVGPTRTDVATVTNTSAAVTDTSITAADAGRIVNTPTGKFPAGTTVLSGASLVPGASFVASAAATGADTAVIISDPPSGIGPGWASTTQFPIGTEVPVILSGFGKINVAGAAVAASDLIGLGNVALTGGVNNNVGGITVAAVATTIGTIIAVALEAQAARDTSLTAMGIGGHEPIRALIGHM